MPSRQFLLWPCQFCLDMAARNSLIGADDIGDMAYPTPLEQCKQLVQTLSAAPLKRIQIRRHFISRDNPHRFALHSHLALAWTRRIWWATWKNRIHLRFFHAGPRHPSPGMVFPQHPQMTPTSPRAGSQCQQVADGHWGSVCHHPPDTAPPTRMQYRQARQQYPQQATSRERIATPTDSTTNISGIMAGLPVP